MLKITREVLDELIAHARKDAPIEACGYLGAQDGHVRVSLALTNTDASPEHYSMDPAEQFAAVRQFRRQGLQLRAVYHSHPESPARMSQEDIRLAFDPNLTYVIVSLLGEEPVVKAFTVEGKLQEEGIEIVPE